MKSIKVLTAIFGIAVSLSTGFAVAQTKDVHVLKPKHGGLMSEVNHIEYELVLKPEGTELYLQDHGKPMDLTNTSATLTVLDGAEKTGIKLLAQSKMLKGDGITLKNPNYTAIATVEFPNKKKSTVRFSNKASK